MHGQGVDVSVHENGVEVVSGGAEVIVGDMGKVSCVFSGSRWWSGVVEVVSEVVEDGVSVSVGEVLHEKVGGIESVLIWAWIVAEVMPMQCVLVYNRMSWASIGPRCQGVTGAGVRCGLRWEW